MGFFSFNCLGCDHPFLAPHATEDRNEWMSEVVEVKDGIRGTYDGYGRLEDAVWVDDGESVDYGENELGMRPCAYHVACWEQLGRPGAGDRVCESASDQGHFFPEHLHNMADPRETGSLILTYEVATVAYYDADWREYLGKEPPPPKTATGRLVIEGGKYTLNGQPVRSISRIVLGTVEIQDYEITVNVSWHKVPSVAKYIDHAVDEFARPLQIFRVDLDRSTRDRWVLLAPMSHKDEVREAVQGVEQHLADLARTYKKYADECSEDRSLDQLPTRVTMRVARKAA